MKGDGIGELVVYRTWKQKIMRMIMIPPARLALLFVEGARPRKPRIMRTTKMAVVPTR